MTLFGPDISSYEAGLDLSQLLASEAQFVIAKATEGTYYTDADYDGWRRQAAGMHLPFVWYHFLSAEDAHAQAAHTAAHVGDTSLPGMLDFEPTNTMKPTLAQAVAYIDAAAAAGLHLRLVYLPHWWWLDLGSPDLTPLLQRGLHLVSSSYPGGAGTAEQIYPGDYAAAGWAPYGGMSPSLWQFTNSASAAGQHIDYNAFRGTAAELAAILNPTTGGSTMGQIPPSISQRWPDLAGDFPPDAPFTDETALIWADAGARAAALFALEARDAINQLAARLAAPAPAPVVDVTALAQALEPLLTGFTAPSAMDVANAVVAHLAAQLEKP